MGVKIDAKAICWSSRFSKNRGIKIRLPGCT
jgi:hypothetical protein